MRSELIDTPRRGRGTALGGEGIANAPLAVRAAPDTARPKAAADGTAFSETVFSETAFSERRPPTWTGH